MVTQELPAHRPLTMPISTSANVNTTQLTGTPDGTVIVPTHDWQTFLYEHTKKFKIAVFSIVEVEIHIAKLLNNFDRGVQFHHFEIFASLLTVLSNR